VHPHGCARRRTVVGYRKSSNLRLSSIPHHLAYTCPSPTNTLLHICYPPTSHRQANIMPAPGIITKIMCQFAQQTDSQYSNENSLLCQSPTTQRIYFDLVPILLVEPSSRSSSSSPTGSMSPCSPSIVELPTITTHERPRPRRASSSASSSSPLSTPARRYSVPIDRFWSADQHELSTSSAEAVRDLLVEVSVSTSLGSTKSEDEIVGRNLTNKVLKATLCYSDSLKAKNGFIDVL
jgi:hypothetical protein